MSKRPITFKQWAKRYGIAKLAQEIGVCRTTPYKWLSGTKPCGYYTAILIQAIACRDFVELTVEEIMGGKK